MNTQGLDTIKRRDDSLRVALVGDYPIDNGQIQGGVQAAFAYLVKGLSRIDNLKIHVLTLGTSGKPGSAYVGPNGCTLHLLPLFPRFERVRNYQTYQAALNQVLAQIQPDLVHAQETSADAYVAIRSGYPTVITAHGMRREDGKYFSSWRRRLRNYFDTLVVERYTLNHVRHLIAISRYVTDYFTNRLGPDCKMYAVPNAIDERFFDLLDTSDRPVVLFAGRVIPRKRVMELVQAFARVVQQIPAARLHIAGECSSEPSCVESIRGWISQANLEEPVRFLGPLSEAMVLGEFASSSIVVLPSSQETAPMVIAQAMAAGKPVVATRVGGVTEMIGETGERGLLVQVGDVSGLAQAMLCLLQEPAKRAHLGQAGHVFARENYHLDSVAQRTYAVYKDIVAKESLLNA